MSKDDAAPISPDTEAFAGPLPREEEPVADDTQKKLVESFNEKQDRKAEQKKKAPAANAADKPWLSSNFDASANIALPSHWKDLGDKLSIKLPDANKMQGRRYRRIYEGKLDQMLMYAVQSKGWDSLCVHDRRGHVDATMTHLLAERRAVLLGTKEGQKKLKAAGFTEEDFERLRNLHISHTRLAKLDKKAAAETDPPAAAEEQDKTGLKAGAAKDAPPPDAKQDEAAAPAVQAAKKLPVPPVTL